jgi:hypothetical protein
MTKSWPNEALMLLLGSSSTMRGPELPGRRQTQAARPLSVWNMACERFRSTSRNAVRTVGDRGHLSTVLGLLGYRECPMGAYSDVIEMGPRVDLNYQAFGKDVINSFGNAPHILGLRQVDGDKLITVLTVTAWCSRSQRKSLHGT